MAQQSFLIDANSFIEPYRKYYSFDFTTAFWDQMGQNIKDGNIVILDIVILNDQECHYTQRKCHAVVSGGRPQAEQS